MKAGATRETLTMTIAHTSKFSTHFYRCEYFILGIKIRVKSPMQFNVVATTRGASEAEKKVVVFICHWGGEVCLHIHVSVLCDIDID